MGQRFKKQISLILIFSILLGILTFPQPAYARISFRKFFRALGKSARAIGRGSRFVINLPNKATRWMGPVIGPIAATILTKNIAKNPRWSKILKGAGRANRAFKTLEEQEKYLTDLRKAYRDQANDLRKQANDIRESRKKMLNKLTTGDITFDDYKKHVVALDDIAEVYEKAADKFEKSAEKMRAEDIARIFSRDLLRQVWGQVKDTVVFETTKELKKVIDPDIIQKLISGKGVNLDTILDGLTSSQINKILNEGDYQNVDLEALKGRVRERIKEILEENKQAFKKNWRGKIDEIIKKMIKDLEEEKKKLPQPSSRESEASTEPDNSKELDELLEFEDDGCNPGYKMDKKLGKCIQENCYDEAIKYAHWSHTGDCICGSSGSINENPEDPNKECTYSKDNKSCPSCVYACVYFDEECPSKK